MTISSVTFPELNLSYNQVYMHVYDGATGHSRKF